MLRCIDAAEGLRTLASNSISLTVTSPPFDDLRQYGGHRFDFENIAEQLFRVTMPNGVVAWNIQEQIIDGSESGTSSYQRLFFKQLGFSLYNTLVIESSGVHRGSLAGWRYGSAVRYVFVLVKGTKPRVFHQIRDVLNKSRKVNRTSKLVMRNQHGEIVVRKTPFRYSNRVWRARSNFWKIAGSPTDDQDALQAAHGALMHERLAEDLILSWSDKGDLVLDPLAGLGTTWKLATIQKRRFIGFEIVPEYCRIATERVRRAVAAATSNHVPVP